MVCTTAPDLVKSRESNGLARDTPTNPRKRNKIANIMLHLHFNIFSVLLM